MNQPPTTYQHVDRAPVDALRTAVKVVHCLSVVIFVLGVLLAIIIVGSDESDDGPPIAVAVGVGLSSIFTGAMGGLAAAYARWRLHEAGQWTPGHDERPLPPPA